MFGPASIIVTGKDGWRGTIETALLLGGNEAQVLIRLDDGGEALVPSTAVSLQQDGSYYVALPPEELMHPPDGAARIPGRPAAPRNAFVLTDSEATGGETNWHTQHEAIPVNPATAPPDTNAGLAQVPPARLENGPVEIAGQARVMQVFLGDGMMTADGGSIGPEEEQPTERRHAVTKTVVALFEDFRVAQDATRDLLNSGFRRDDVSLIASNAAGKHHAQLESDVDSDAVGAGEGAGIGAVLGGLAGLLIGLGALAIPGVGPIIAAGPLAATLAGAGVGAVAGGLVGVLVDAGVPEDEAELYANGVRDGGTLLTVRAMDDQAGRARDILDRYGPVDVHTRAGKTETGDLPATDAGQAQPDQPEAPYSTSPMQVDEQIGPERSSSAYGGAEYRNVERAGTEFTQEQPLSEPMRTSGNMGTNEQGEGFSSGAGQAGAGYQGGPNEAESDRLSADFQKHYDAVYGVSGAGYERYVPSYRFGYSLAQGKEFYGRRWTEVEPGVRKQWESQHPQESWEAYREAVRHGWEAGSASGGDQPADDADWNGADWTGQESRLDRPSYQGPEDRRI